VRCGEVFSDRFIAHFLERQITIVPLTVHNVIGLKTTMWRFWRTVHIYFVSQKPAQTSNAIHVLNKA